MYVYIYIHLFIGHRLANRRSKRANLNPTPLPHCSYYLFCIYDISLRRRCTKSKLGVKSTIIYIKDAHKESVLLCAKCFSCKYKV